MLRPSYEDILEKVNETVGEEKFDSKYSVVIAIAKRAREIVLEGDADSSKVVKSVSKSIDDIVSQKVSIKRQKAE